MLVDQNWISLPLLLMIVTPRIKETNILLIFLHLPSVLPLKNMLIILLPLLITYTYLSQFVMILLFTIPLRKTILYMSRLKEDTALVDTMKKYAFLKTGFIIIRVLITTGKFTIVIDFTEKIQIWVLPPFNTNIVWNIVQMIGVFESLISFTSPVELVFAIFLLLFHWSHPIQIPMFDMLENLTLSFFNWRFEFMWWYPFQTALLYWLSSWQE